MANRSPEKRSKFKIRKVWSPLNAYGFHTVAKLENCQVGPSGGRDCLQTKSLPLLICGSDQLAKYHFLISASFLYFFPFSEPVPPAG